LSGTGSKLAEEIAGKVKTMISKQETQYHAARMAIATGHTPDVELMWRIQQDDGQSECFGRVPDCMKPDCPWDLPCRQFLSFAYGRELGVRFIPSTQRPGKTG
jgi:hypothetical protein